jgi:glucose 1-dehydrogenase
MMQFTGKSAIVTGAGQGIGLEICKQLVAAGADVLLNDIDTLLAQQAVEQVLKNTHAGRCISCAGDAGDPVFLKEMVEHAIQAFGKLDILVANAGITVFGEFFSYTPEAFEQVMRLNLSGSFFLTQAAALQMKKQPGGGAIVLMSSVTGHQAHKHLAAYGMSKAALEMLAKNLVLELSPYRITINAVAPGATLTERTGQDAAYLETWSSLTPIGKPATVTDIASAVLFLVSDHAKHITGQTLIVDGGWTSISPQP